MTNVEEEVVYLKAVTEIINSMVNFEMMDLVGSDPDTEVHFKSTTHQRLFNVLLVDFLSRTDERGPVTKRSYLSALKTIASHPNFDIDGSIQKLREATLAFSTWLVQSVTVDVWLAAIDTDTTFELSRLSFLKMCGDISKHNILRSIGVAEQLKEVLAKNNVNVELTDAMLALDDFYQRFHTDILSYHVSTIAEFLNNIRWGIFRYLRPEFERSIVYEKGPDPLRYGIANKFSQNIYWELMNEVRSQPYVRPFEVTKRLKMRY